MASTATSWPGAPGRRLGRRGGLQGSPWAIWATALARGGAVPRIAAPGPRRPPDLLRSVLARATRPNPLGRLARRSSILGRYRAPQGARRPPCAPLWNPDPRARPQEGRPWGADPRATLGAPWATASPWAPCARPQAPRGVEAAPQEARREAPRGEAPGAQGEAVAQGAGRRREGAAARAPPRGPRRRAPGARRRAPRASPTPRAPRSRRAAPRGARRMSHSPRGRLGRMSHRATAPRDECDIKDRRMRHRIGSNATS